MEEFTSKIDTWLLLVFTATIVVSVGGGLLAVRKGGIKSYLSGFILVVIGAVLPMWLMLGTTYTVTDEMLIVRAGPMSWEIPIAAISLVKETRSSRSGPALSLDRLRIYYGNGRSIMVSPKDQHRFRLAIGHAEE